MKQTSETIDPAWEQLVHQDFIAMPIRVGEPVSAGLSVASHAEPEPLRVWRLSPAGVEFINSSTYPFALDDAVVIRLQVGAQVTDQTGRIVQVKPDFPNGSLLGITFDADKTREQQSIGLSTRKLTRWTCHPIYFPTGSMNNPGKFSDKIHMRVLNISRHGLLVATSLRNKYLLRGLQLDGVLSCPMADAFSFQAEIITSRVKKMGNESVNVIGLSFTQICRKDVKKLGAYIAQFGSHEHVLPSPVRLKKEGYGLVDVSGSIDWDYVRTQEDYNQVLELRRTAYRSVEGWPVDADDHLISDDFDLRSRIVTGKYRGKVIATLRVCFHRPEDVFEEELYITFPPDFPPRDTLVEASRAATHPDFRGSELFMNMMRFTMLITLQGSRQWVVQSTYDYLSPLYKKLGFKEVGSGWMHPQLTGRKMQMFIGNIHWVLNTRKGNPFQYQSLVPYIEAYLSSDAFDKLTLPEKVKMQVWRHSAPAYRLFTKALAVKSAWKRRSKKPKTQ